MQPIERLFHEHIGLAYDKQVYLADSIGSQHRWQFDLVPGTVTFNGQLTFAVQLLGTQSDEHNTWLWAWANDASGLPDRLLRAARDLKAYGEQHDIAELTTAELPISEMINGLRLAAVASGLCAAKCFYRGEYDGGALFLLVTDESFVRRVSDPVLRIERIFPEMLQQFSVADQKLAFAHYLRAYDLTVTHTGNTVRGENTSGGAISGTFEPELTRLEREGPSA
ncbi:MAG: hypothetical protein GYB64_09905 [Chloroflexi bacterium]|nr:hypothetical protein [Chloroflexota bacterium]